MQRQAVMALVGILVVCNLGLIAYLIKDRHKQGVTESLQMVYEQEVVAEEEQDDKEKEVLITADTDLGKKTTSAMVAKVNYPITFKVIEGEETDIVEVLGSNGFAEYPQSNEAGFVWTPKRSGIFEVNVVDDEGNKKTSRRINVSGITDQDYYQLNNIITQETENGVKFSTSIFSMPKNADNHKAKPVTAFSIGEENIWTKTIKDYDNAQSVITEGKDFILDRGTYFIRAALKDKYSIEDEDFKTTTYEKKKKDGHNITIHSIKHTVVDNANDGKSDQFVVDASCSEGCQLVYAFFVSDNIDSKRVTDGVDGYSTSNVFTCPVTPWEYTVTVRVKHKENSDPEISDEKNPLLLPNSYEAIDSIVVKGNGVEGDIHIKNLQIEPFILKDYYSDDKEWNRVMQTVDDPNKKGVVYVNNNNYITINMEEEGSYGYSAWVIDDGEQITLENVEDGEKDNKGNKFVYYPKSGGGKGKAADPEETHTLYVQVIEYDTYGYVLNKITKTYTLEVE